MTGWLGAVTATPVLAPPPPPARPWSAPTCRLPVAILRRASSPQAPCSVLALPARTRKRSLGRSLGRVFPPCPVLHPAHQPLPHPSLQASWPKAPNPDCRCCLPQNCHCLYLLQPLLSSSFCNYFPVAATVLSIKLALCLDPCYFWVVPVPVSVSLQCTPVHCSFLSQTSLHSLFSPLALGAILNYHNASLPHSCNDDSLSP